MSEVAWDHRYVEANGLRIHYVRHGSGAPLVLLHGWPEFWLTFRKNIPLLAENFDVVAPDLRGFGDTEKPGLPDPPSRLLEELALCLPGIILVTLIGFENIPSGPALWFCFAWLVLGSVLWLRRGRPAEQQPPPRVR